jgi:BirA family transcriptional regulator, biotin operon repressor / biotin---[acetyl-CoA-carboxylase] ligase
VSELLDRVAIWSALPSPQRDALSTIHIAERTPSTQADALAAGTPARGCALFLAEHQLAGQGRQGRAWVSAPAGASLAMSLSRRFESPMARLSGLSLVAGIAIAEALELEGVGLKWPNDLVCGGRKLGGILVNLRAASGGATDAVVGIGINIALPDASGIDQPWTDLARCGAPPRTRNLLVARLLEGLLPAFSRFEAEGLSPFLERWQRLDAYAGRAVRVHDGDRVHEGWLDGITASGALRLRTDGEECIFHSGEVSLRPA